jgi:hypothetical protein
MGNALHDEFSGTQLDAVLAFLAEQPGQVSPITITLWGNDVGEFVRSCAADLECIFDGAPAAMAVIASNLEMILERLRAAAPGAEIIVTGAWNHRVGFFDVSDPLIVALNYAMDEASTATRARFADPFPLFNPQGDGRDGHHLPAVARVHRRRHPSIRRRVRGSRRHRAAGIRL